MGIDISNFAKPQNDASSLVLPGSVASAISIAEVPWLGPKPPVLTAVTGFQSGHGFFTNLAGSATSNVNDTSAQVMGSQCATITTGGDGGNNYLKKNSISPTIDTTGKMIRVWLRLPNPADIANLNDVFMYVGNDNIVTNYYAFNSIMEGFSADYYGNDYANALNGWMGITMTFGEAAVTGAPTRTAINSIWLRVNDAHSTAVTVQFGGIELVPEPAAGTVSFTFDDSRLTHYSQARPKLAQYRFPATAYTISEVVDVTDAGLGTYTLPGVPAPYYMSTAQLKELQEYQGWEIGAHAFYLANHNMPNGDIDVTAALESEMQSIKGWLATRGLRGLQHYALPKGRHNQTVYDLARRYFRSCRTTFSNSSGAGWIKHESYPPTDRNKLVVFYVYGTTTLAQMEAAVDSAFTNKEWLIFVFHDLVTTPDTVNYNDTQAKLADFSTLVDYVATKGIAVRTVGDVIEHGA
jgi:Polysaccharide deacetylase